MAKTIDWKKLRHAQGPATRVPAEIKALSGGDESEADEAFRVLFDTLVGRHEWVSASGPAAALLIDGLSGSGDVRGKLVLLAEIAGARQGRAWLAPRSETASPEDVVQAFEAGVEVLTGLAKSKDAGVRAALLALFATLPTLSGETAPIAKKAMKDRDETVRASAVLALARLLEGDDAWQGVLADASKDAAPIVRGAATLARLRGDRTLQLADASAGIHEWLEAGSMEPSTESQLPWFGGAWPASAFQPLDGPSQGLVDVAKHRGDGAGLLDVLIGIAKKGESGIASKRIGKVLIEVAELSRFEPTGSAVATVARVEELSSEQRKLMTKIAGTRLLPGAGSGLPASGESRKRWIGVSPPGALDKVVKFTVDDEPKEGPLWWARRELLLAGASEWLPDEVGRHVSGADRWYAIVEFGVNSYGGGYGEMDPETLEREVAALPHDERFFRRIGEVADDLAARFEAAEREGSPLWASLTASSLVFLPLVRAKKEIEARWDSLVHVGGEPIAREVLAALPPDRREAIVWRCAPLRGALAETLSTLVPVFDLAPSERIAESIATQMANEETRSDLELLGTLEPFLEMLRKVTKEHPRLKKTLAGAI